MVNVPLRVTINLGFTIALLILLAVSGVSFLTARGLTALDQEVSRAQEVQGNLQDVLSLMIDAETGQRGFLLTGDDSYLEPLTNAPGTTDQKMAELRASAASSPDFQQKLGTLQSLITAKFSELQETVALQKTEGPAAALPVERTNLGKKTMDQMRSQVASMESDENAILQRRNQELATESQQTIAVTSVGSILAVLIVGAAIVLINLSVSAQQRAADERDRLLAEVSQERARAEDAAREALATSAMLRTILETVPVGLVVADSGGTLTFANASASAVHGKPIPMSTSVHNPSNLQAVLRPDGQPFPLADLPLHQALLRGETTWDVETRIKRTDGTEVVVLGAGSPVRATDGSVVGAVAVYQDITERKRAEEERERLLRAVEVERSRFRAILDSAANAIIYLDAATGHLLANPAAERLFGHGLVPDQGAAQFVGQILANGCPLSLEDLPSQRAIQGEATDEQEILIVQPDGRQVPVLESAATVREPDGRVVGAVIVFQDISTMKDLGRLREEWTSVVAHDLRQPLTMIIGYGGAAAKQAERTAPDLKRPLDNILLSAHRLNRMIGDLLDASRLEAQRLQLARENADLVSLTGEIVERVRTITPGSAIRVQITDEIPRLSLDPHRFEQILGNLISNGVKYGSPDTEILVTIERHDRETLVAVTNHGEGIVPDSMSKLFNRFHRIQHAGQRRVEGLGLGLYIAKGLVEAHGGRIWVESTPGETTTFAFTLPLPS